ncbi:unnamed protein product, partial [Ectocarpus sp. 12 AP-2014]
FGSFDGFGEFSFQLCYYRFCGSESCRLRSSREEVSEGVKRRRGKSLTRTGANMPSAEKARGLYCTMFDTNVSGVCWSTFGLKRPGTFILSMSKGYASMGGNNTQNEVVT